MTKQEIDERIELGKKPILAHIRLADCPDFVGKLTECPEIYQSVAVWPMVVLGSYRGVVVILEARRI